MKRLSRLDFRKYSFSQRTVNAWNKLSADCLHSSTVVPVLGDSRRERPHTVCGHVINVPTHLNVKLPAIGGHLPNADADSHLLVVRTCYNVQCEQMPRFRWSFQPKIARGAHSNLRPSVHSNSHAAIWWQTIFHIESKFLRFLVRSHLSSCLDGNLVKSNVALRGISATTKNVLPVSCVTSVKA